MPTPKRISSKSARKADNKSDSEKLSLRSKQANENNGAQRCCNSFLKTKIQCTVPSFLIRDWGQCTFNVITQENYEFLRDSYLRYAGLLNIKAEHTPGNTLNESMTQLYYDMQTILSDYIGVNIEHEGGKLYFTLWKCHRWGYYDLYYFPVKFLTQVNVELRRIGISFFNRLMRANGITSILDCDEHYSIIEYILSDYEDDELDKDRLRDKRRINSYQTGAIHKLLTRIQRTSYHDDLLEALRGYCPRSEWESQLIEAMEEGIEFTKPKKPIMHYGYDPFYMEDPDIRPIDLERQICVVYEDDDIVTRTLIDLINSDYQESYEILPASTMKLTPHTESLFKMTDDYPDRFFKWADRFIRITNNMKI